MVHIIVVLNFWASWCPPCRAELQSFVRRELDVVFQAINVTAPLLSSLCIALPILFDESDTVAQQFNVRHVGAIDEATLHQLMNR